MSCDFEPVSTLVYVPFHEQFQETRDPFVDEREGGCEITGIAIVYAHFLALLDQTKTDWCSGLWNLLVPGELVFHVVKASGSEDFKNKSPGLHGMVLL